MRHNLQLYHTLLEQLRHWLPRERVTRRRNLALVVLGLYLSRSVHLDHIARTWPVPGRLVCLTQRLRRFLDNKRVESWRLYEPVVLHLLKAFRGRELTLMLDVTKVGGNQRMLMVALAYRRRALPLTWRVYPQHSGGTSVVAHCALLGRLHQLIPSNCSVVVLGDAEFRNGDLLRWLADRGWHYVIRQNSDTYVCTPGGTWQRLCDIALRPGQTRLLAPVWLAKTKPFPPTALLLHWAVGEDRPWFLATSFADTHRTLRAYRRRMWIEEMFGDMKRHGFDLEATRLHHLHRIDALILGVAIAYVWFVSIGSWIVKNGLRPCIDRKLRRDKSYFRLGLDWILACWRLGKPVPLRFAPYP